MDDYHKEKKAREKRAKVNLSNKEKLREIKNIQKKCGIALPGISAYIEHLSLAKS